MPRSRPADVPAYLTFHEQHSLITRARPTGSLRGHPVSKIDLYRKRLGANRWWYDRGQLVIPPWRMDGDSRLLIRYYGLNVRPQQYIYTHVCTRIHIEAPANAVRDASRKPHKDSSRRPRYLLQKSVKSPNAPRG